MKVADEADLSARDRFIIQTTSGHDRQSVGSVSILTVSLEEALGVSPLSPFPFPFPSPPVPPPNSSTTKFEVSVHTATTSTFLCGNCSALANQGPLSSVLDKIARFNT